MKPDPLAPQTGPSPTSFHNAYQQTAPSTSILTAASCTTESSSEHDFFPIPVPILQPLLLLKQHSLFDEKQHPSVSLKQHPLFVEKQHPSVSLKQPPPRALKQQPPVVLKQHPAWPSYFFQRSSSSSPPMLMRRCGRYGSRSSRDSSSRYVDFGAPG